MNLFETLMRDTIGMLFLGYMFAMMLYGVTVTQVFIYFRNTGKRDSLLLRLLIFSLLLLDTLHVVFITHAMYYYLIMNFTHPQALDRIVWSILAQVLVTSVSDAIVRFVFAKRIWTLSNKNKWLTLAVALVATFAFVVGILYVGTALASDKSLQAQSKLSLYIYGSFGGALVADTVIATLLCTLLWRARTGITRTDRLVNSLMVYTINTGLLTGLAAVAAFILYALLPNNMAYVALHFNLEKLYINSLLVMLNGRSSIRERRSGDEGTRNGTTTLEFQNFSRVPKPPNEQVITAQVEIGVNHDKGVASDDSKVGYYHAY